jgi:predicted helicase
MKHGTSALTARTLARFARSVRELLETNGQLPEVMAQACQALQEMSSRTFFPPEMADFFAQLFAVGIFAAAVRGENPFGANASGSDRDLHFFNHVVLAQPLDLSWNTLVASLEDVGGSAMLQALQDAGIDSISPAPAEDSSMAELFTHFYEDFLAAYDPRQRFARGSFYTPVSVVSFLARSVDHLLEARLGNPNGLVSSVPLDVQILDPAVGTGAFLAGILQVAYQRFAQQYEELSPADRDAAWRAFVADHLIPRLQGFELMPVPWLIAGFTLGLTLAATGVPATQDASFNLRLASALDQPAEPPTPDTPSISVVIGNPPYKGHSANCSPWIEHLLEDYREIDGARLPLAQGKWLQNDYVKFFRVGEWHVESAGTGILAYVTDHSYLDGETFVGMRRHLLATFDDIYILNLEGNARKRTESAGISPDENIFEIEQGVALFLGVKTADHGGDSHEMGTVHYYTCRGTRAEKFAFLDAHDVGTIAWEEVPAGAPPHVFKAARNELAAEFSRFPSIPEIFSQVAKPSPGFITLHDSFAIGFTREDVISHVEALLATSTEVEAREIFSLCTQKQWDYTVAKARLQATPWQDQVAKCLYRPFDYRYTVFDRAVLVHPRQRVTRHLREGSNIALATTRMTKGEEFRHVFVSNLPTEVILLSSATSINAFLFPLYQVTDAGKNAGEDSTTFLNLDIILPVVEQLGLEYVPVGKGDFVQTIGSEDIFGYIYAILHANAYRTRYQPLLERNFPRIPFIVNLPAFHALSRLGSALVDLHLMRVLPPNAIGISLRGNGDNFIDKLPPAKSDLPRFSPSLGEDLGELPINKTQYFSPVPQPAWHFRVGGYQVIHKWLNYRKGRALRDEDVTHLIQVILVVDASLHLLAEIDAVIDSMGGIAAMLATSVPLE